MLAKGQTMTGCCQEYYKYVEENLKCNKGECHLRCTLVPFVGESFSRKGVRSDLRKLKLLSDMPPLNLRKGIAGTTWYTVLFQESVLLL